MKNDNEWTVRYNWGETHNIKRVKGVDVNLQDLWEGQSIVYGDGETFHWLLTEKSKQAVIDAWENTPFK